MNGCRPEKHPPQRSSSLSERKRNITTLTEMSLCLAALCVASFLVIPLPFTPVVLSLHTVVVNVVGLLLKPRETAYVLLTYLLMGLIGLPVLAGGTAGPGKLVGPTGGFYVGFLLAAVAISLLKGNRHSVRRYLLVIIGVGIPLQHLCAVLFFCFYNGFQWQAAIGTVSVPFLPGDVLKAAISSWLGNTLNRIILDR